MDTRVIAAVAIMAVLALAKAGSLAWNARERRLQREALRARNRFPGKKPDPDV